MQRYLHCKLHKIHNYVLAVIDWFLHKEFSTTEKYLHFFLENTVSCKLPVSKTWIAKACPLLIHHRDKTQHYVGIAAQSLCLYSLDSHILVSNYYFIPWNVSFSCWFLGTSHCQVPVCGSGRICCFKLRFPCFELETIKISNLATCSKCLQMVVVPFKNPNFAVSNDISYTFTVSNLKMPSLKGCWCS